MYSLASHPKNLIQLLVGLRQIIVPTIQEVGQVRPGAPDAFWSRLYRLRI